MVQPLTDALNMNQAELKRLATADPIRAKSGKIPLELLGNREWNLSGEGFGSTSRSNTKPT
jgi:hypothetical protein